MAEEKTLLIRNIPEDTLTELDRLVVKNGYKNRNQLVVELIRKYVAMQDKMFIDLLPTMCKMVVKDELKRLLSEKNSMIETVYLALLKSVKASQYITEFIAPSLDEELNSKLDDKKIGEIIRQIEETNTEKG